MKDNSWGPLIPELSYAKSMNFFLILMLLEISHHIIVVYVTCPMNRGGIGLIKFSICQVIDHPAC